MQRDDKKRIRHCEYHPNVNHLDISSHWQRLGDPHETVTHKNVFGKTITYKTYYVVNTNSRVAFTSMTISRYVSLKVVDIWLINRSMAVGRNKVRELLVRGLLIMKSMNDPDLPLLSTEQWRICLRWYLPRSLLPVYTTLLCLSMMCLSIGVRSSSQVCVSKGYHL